MNTLKRYTDFLVSPKVLKGQTDTQSRTVYNLKILFEQQAKIDKILLDLSENVIQDALIAFSLTDKRGCFKTLRESFETATSQIPQLHKHLQNQIYDMDFWKVARREFKCLIPGHVTFTTLSWMFKQSYREFENSLEEANCTLISFIRKYKVVLEKLNENIANEIEVQLRVLEV